MQEPWLGIPSQGVGDVNDFYATELLLILFIDEDTFVLKEKYLRIL